VGRNIWIDGRNPPLPSNVAKSCLVWRNNSSCPADLFIFRHCCKGGGCCRYANRFFAKKIIISAFYFKPNISLLVVYIILCISIRRRHNSLWESTMKIKHSDEIKKRAEEFQQKQNLEAKKGAYFRCA